MANNTFPNTKKLSEGDTKSLSELKTVSGFGDIKCQKYGNDIIKILSDYTNS